MANQTATVEDLELLLSEGFTIEEVGSTLDHVVTTLTDGRSERMLAFPAQEARRFLQHPLAEMNQAMTAGPA